LQYLIETDVEIITITAMWHNINIRLKLHLF
jgi:hypothetical protein